MIETLRATVARIIAPDSHVVARELYPRAAEEEKIEEIEEKKRKIKRAARRERDLMEAARDAVESDDDPRDIADRYDHATIEFVENLREKAVESDHELANDDD